MKRSTVQTERRTDGQTDSMTARQTATAKETQAQSHEVTTLADMTASLGLWQLGSNSLTIHTY